MRAVLGTTGTRLLMQQRGLVYRSGVPLVLSNRGGSSGDGGGVRWMSSYVLDGMLGRRGGGGGGGGGSAAHWPVSKANTVFNIVPQGHR